MEERNELYGYHLITESLINGQFKQAANYVNEYNFTAIDLLKITEDLNEDAFIPFYHEEKDIHDVLTPIQNIGHIALIIEKAMELKQETK